MAGGLAGKILWVNLTLGDLREEPSEKYRPWIGGRSLGSFLLSQQPELYDPAPAVQPLVITAGPLVGTAIPMGTRTAVLGRSQVSGGFFFSNVGGDFGARMKFAGYDALVIQAAVLWVLADERVGLKTTRVGHDGVRPAGHAVQPAKRLHGGGARSPGRCSGTWSRPASRW